MTSSSEVLVLFSMSRQTSPIHHAPGDTLGYGRTLNPHTNLTQEGHPEVRLPSSRSRDRPLVSEATPEAPSVTLAPTVVSMDEAYREDTPHTATSSTKTGKTGSPQTGPMCRSARDIQLFIGAVMSAAPAARDPALYLLLDSPRSECAVGPRASCASA
ncbi:hypothetical protein A0H81_00079 [Grifola frondosa]|uniref:Uncharacterized protein n=1 Tax=Grifola frondosa TaxID=5627 RepID=A0A1C7MRH2_GRIFR|nr:hypothetical protein A0H81_00079 [Grifola frondosa]